MIQIAAVAVITALSALVLRTIKPDLALPVLICGGIVLLLMAVDFLEDTLALLSDISALTGLDSGMVKLILKIIGVGYLTEFTAQLTTDFGAPSLADKVILCGKLFILVMAMPILRAMLSFVQAFLQLL